MTTTIEERSPLKPWVGVPCELSELFRPYLDTLAEEMIDEILAGVPEYSRPQDEEYARLVRLAVEGALRQFVDLIMDPDSSWETVAGVYREIGWAEAREGRSLDVLQTSLRLGARVAWRRLAAESEHLNVSRRTLASIAEAIFAFLDEIARAATEGYTKAREQEAGELEHRRRRLLDLMLAEPPAAPQAIADLARLAQWRVPRTVAVVVLYERGQQPFSHPSLPPDVLADVNRREPCLIIPDPEGPGRGRMLESALRNWVAAMGPTVRTEDAAKSLRWAREALPLARRGIVPSDRLIRCAEHMPTLVVFRDEELVRAVADLRLAPLKAVRPRHRERLMRTLLACLQNGFNATEVANRLHVHPQTVRYRLHQLEELFGDALYEPESRLEMEMVLTVWLTAPKDDPRPADVIRLEGSKRPAAPKPLAVGDRR
ncbi:MULTISPECIES: PucR family transcriptional regulator [Actinomadura]|uniref:PucR family transcriptional regulator n=2 Tax=Actinomadura yumaensis TaxID=111807 RepID=A0ABW2CSL1_9ACTN|nr:helix-turn-helix domain-containing protein [Actinomadura sp. J1-007]